MTDDEIRAMLEGATPGPWRLGSWGDNVFGTGPRDEWLTICRVKRDDAPLEESPDGADARLIAAAPDAFAEVLRLREALREADLHLAYLDERQPTGTTPAIRARIAAALKGAAQ